MTAVAHHDPSTLFERAWQRAVRDGSIGAQRRAALVAEAERGIRRIAGVLGTEHLREDLERAMRAMLGLVELHLNKVSGGDVGAAARSLAEKGLLFHTKGASQAVKRVLAVEEGLEPDEIEPATLRRFDEQVVTQFASMPYAEFAERERGAETRRRRRGAARALAAVLEGEPPDLSFNEPEQVVMTGLMALAWSPKRAWPSGMKDFEALLAAAREAPGRLDELPAGVPRAYAPIVEEIRRELAPGVAAVLADATLPLHRLVAGDERTNPLAHLVAVPDATLDAIDALGAETTSHWDALTGGRTDEPWLLWLMLDGTMGLDAKAPLTPKAADTLLRGPLSRPPADQALGAWLDANAPHPWHADLVELWETFWDERDALGDEPAADEVRLFAAEWLPLKAGGAGKRGGGATRDA